MRGGCLEVLGVDSHKHYVLYEDDGWHPIIYSPFLLALNLLIFLYFPWHILFLFFLPSFPIFSSLFVSLSLSFFFDSWWLQPLILTLLEDRFVSEPITQKSKPIGWLQERGEGWHLLEELLMTPLLGRLSGETSAHTSFVEGKAQQGLGNFRVPLLPGLHYNLIGPNSYPGDVAQWRLLLCLLCSQPGSASNTETNTAHILCVAHRDTDRLLSFSPPTWGDLPWTRDHLETAVSEDKDPAISSSLVALSSQPWIARSLQTRGKGKD